MPELPEVETIRIQLNQALRSLKIVNVKVLSPKNFIGSVGEVIGEKVEGVERRAKIILIKLSSGKCLAVHLKLTGQLIYKSKQEFCTFEVKTPRAAGIAFGDARPRCPKDSSDGGGIAQSLGPFDAGELPNKFTRVIISFDNGGRLYFNDLRKFGWMKLIRIKNQELRIKGTCAQLPELAKLGPEAIDEKEFSLNYLKKILSKSKKPVKLVLMDQEKLAGVGNIYANEALFLAGIKPTRPANSLTEKEIEKLRNKVIKVLKEAILHKGTSDKDEAYRQITGEKGRHQNYLRVYGREGQKCPKCGGKIVRVKIGGRGTFYCPKCQK